MKFYTRLTIENGAAAITDEGDGSRHIASFRSQDLHAVIVEPRYAQFGKEMMFVKRSRNVTLIISGQPIQIVWRDEDAEDGRHSAYDAAAVLDVFVRENAR